MQTKKFRCKYCGTEWYGDVSQDCPACGKKNMPRVKKSRPPSEKSPAIHDLSLLEQINTDLDNNVVLQLEHLVSYIESIMLGVKYQLDSCDTSQYSEERKAYIEEILRILTDTNTEAIDMHIHMRDLRNQISSYLKRNSGNGKANVPLPNIPF